MKLTEKRVMILGLFLNAFCLLWFTQVNAFYYLMMSRIFTGIFQQIVNIYFPVWSDCFASEEKKSSWLSILLIGQTTGNICGFVLMASLQDAIGWRKVFFIQFAIILAITFGFFMTPTKYVNIRESSPKILDH